MRRFVLTAGLLGLCAYVALSASQDSAQVFKARSDLVVLHVNVFDKRSDAVPDLPESAFLVFEDDKAQNITFFSSGDVPVAVGLVIDNSSSMIARRSMVSAGVAAFAESSHPDDELFSVFFNEHVRYGLPEGVPFTTSGLQISSGLRRFPAAGKTALYDAIVSAVQHFETASLQKHVLVVLSDGGDNASLHGKDEMLAAVTASDAIIYTVSPPDGSVARGQTDADVMRRLAQASGGVAYFPRTDRQVVDSFEEIAGNIRRGYSIGYVPDGAARPGEYRRVRVMVRMPGRTNLTARVRHGYTSQPDAAR